MNPESNFTKTPNSLLADHRLTAMDKIVYIGIKKFAFGSKSVCFPSLYTLGQAIDINPKNISRHLKTLAKLRYIKITHRRDKSNHYEILALPIVPAKDVHVNEDAPDTKQGHQIDDSQIVDSTISNREFDDYNSSNLRRKNTMKKAKLNIDQNLKNGCVISPNVEMTPTSSGSVEAGFNQSLSEIDPTQFEGFGHQHGMWR